MNFREFKDKTRKMPFFGSDLADIFSLSPESMRNQLTRWKKSGLLVELRRGLYVLGREERQVNLSREVAAANIYQPSYISLETALSHYKMIPEKTNAIISITTRKTKEFNNPEGGFIYRHLKPSLFFGFIPKKDDNGFPYFMADPEKALLDYLYLNMGSIHPSDKQYFSGSLRLQNTALLNKKKLLSYAGRFKVKKLDAILENIK
ncbi:MAG: hypothetical protein FJZ04_04430 [Candidatus Moranbacteria bacterium]|nr:hypothetical protein [Candidatus Moranbacteria bacterium]